MPWQHLGHHQYTAVPFQAFHMSHALLDLRISRDLAHLPILKVHSQASPNANSPLHLLPPDGPPTCKGADTAHVAKFMKVIEDVERC